MNLSSFPSRITLELTNYCNLSCKFCPRHHMEQEFGIMDVALAHELIKEMASYKPVTVVPFFRGESLMHPQWDIILQYLMEYNVGPIQLTTNATLLTHENTEKLLNVGLDFLSFSIDTIDPKCYQEIRGMDYNIILNNILYFLKRQEERQVPIVVQVSAVKTEKNASDIQNFIDFWLPKVDRVRIYEEHSKDGKIGSLKQPTKIARKACHKVFEDMVIYWNGDVALCNHDWTRRVTGQHIANVRNKGIAVCWNSPTYNSIRQAHENINLSGVMPCESCDHWVVSYLPENHIGQIFYKQPK
ncbi:radical SAM/SPASM domain-containing protein [Lawsonia intracellularis]|uniref:radical SAM/SPASM domain-containing protein n=1 Tax=Lawsonia intracellularis TaxID=29546 RepID=UPI0021E56A46|nr:radical SAM protein [Lawsonia intracellularis]UYH53683.1 radical SAM protein [Lawsonia intracellularis]